MTQARYVGDDVEIDHEIREGNYGRAERLLTSELERQPGSVRLTQKLADVLAKAGQRERAADILCGLAEDFARDGFTAKAVATLKVVQRVDRRRLEAESRLAELILQRNQEVLDTPEAPETAASVPVRSPLFSGIETEELVAAMDGFQLETYDAGDIIFTEGEPGDGIYVLASGTVKVFVRDEAGRNQPVRTLGHGEFFGEIALLTGKPRTATLIAVDPCEVLKLDQTSVDSLAERFPRVPEIVLRFAGIRSGSPQELEARKGGG